MNNEVTVLDGEREDWVDQVALKVVKRSKEDDLAVIKSYFDKRGWDWDIAGFGKMISSPHYDGEYYYLPQDLDKTILTQEAEQRLNAVYELPIDIQGVVIGHQIRMPEKPSLIQVDWAGLAKLAGKAALGAGVLIGGALVALSAGLLSAALHVDPMLIIVLNDSENPNKCTWVEIFWWLD